MIFHHDKGDASVPSRSRCVWRGSSRLHGEPAVGIDPVGLLRVAVLRAEGRREQARRVRTDGIASECFAGESADYFYTLAVSE